jgi:hypothetical protein
MGYFARKVTNIEGKAEGQQTLKGQGNFLSLGPQSLLYTTFVGCKGQFILLLRRVQATAQATCASSDMAFQDNDCCRTNWIEEENPPSSICSTDLVSRVNHCAVRHLVVIADLEGGAAERSERLDGPQTKT